MADAPLDDLHTQFEALLDRVWELEAEWRLLDRIDHDQRPRK